MRNYQVFINEHLLNFSTSLRNIENVDNFLQLNQATNQELHVLVNYLFLESKSLDAEVACNELESLWSEFKSSFKLVSAAGGIVKNQEGKYLIIHRLGQWDLPKGKIEKGEDMKQAAIREVQEECGIDRIQIKEELPVTYHMYKLEGEIIFKPTFWYMMETNYSGKLIPQIEEDITKVEWCDPIVFKNRLIESYSSLRNLIEKSGL